ncbi:MAG: diguanylate cyclase [Candidatus Magnetoovum sp. WYHC-5]|nr:diguanylate cyclase [Candidatus Magnetoovum sp. WYHC-5]
MLTIENSKEKAFTIAGLVRDAITSLMVLQVVEKQDVFLNQIKHTYGLKSIKILKGKPVLEQFQDNLTDDSKHSMPNALEYEVLRTGEVKSVLTENIQNVDFELVIPYKATSSGHVNCLSCHKAKEDEVLGAISLVMDLTKQRRQGMSSLSYMVAVSLIFSLSTLYIIYVFFRPYTELFQKLRKSFAKVEDGVFSCKIDIKLKDEAGDVANSYNNMVDNLSKTLHSISNKVSLLIGHEMAKTGNDIKDTASNVDILVKIYKFKRTIEKDTKKLDIYTRFEQILEDMNIHNYSIYEVKKHNNSLLTVSQSMSNDIVEKLTNNQACTNKPWCCDTIMANANECRAMRTGVIVNCFDFPNICPNFVFQYNDIIQFYYYCIPVYIGGHVGLIVQLVFDKETMQSTFLNIPYVLSYLQEGEPVLEAKTFMEMLKEQSLVDQLTGLYNRRYLEETYSNLCAQITRRSTTLGVLMIDIDFFKQVNDTYGHDVGDKVLQRISQIIKNTLRTSDIVIRYGGEEILALLIDIEKNSAIGIAEKIRQKIENETIEIPGGVLKKTVSIGAAEFPTHTGKFWQCLKFADTVLYKAKEDGRNRAYAFNNNKSNE